MVPHELLEFIEDCRKQRISDGVIEQVLSDAGWGAQAVEDTFAYLRAKDVPRPSGVMPIPQAPSPFISGPALDPPAAHLEKVEGSGEPRIYSPYSIVLSVVLCVSLLVLLHYGISDLVKVFDPELSSQGSVRVSENSTVKLIVNAAVIVPFWIITFVLNYIYHEKRERLRVLLWPYTSVSGWLMIWLLLLVGEFLLNVNATFGIYFVLILLGVVLTGLIWGVQYLRSSGKVNLS